MQADFTYRIDGGFAQIIPESAQAAEEWNRAISPETNGTGKVPIEHLRESLRQLRAAGYRVRMERARRKLSDAELLADLI